MLIKMQNQTVMQPTFRYKLEKVFLEITSRCNLQCRHCYNASNPYVKTELPRTLISRLLKETKAMGCTHVIISGGEPLLHRDVFEILKECRTLGFMVDFITNGTLIDRKKAGYLTSLATRVQVSLDGYNPETNDPVRGAGSFNRIMEGIHFLTSEGNPDSLILRTSITTYILPYIREMVSLLLHTGIKILVFEKLFSQGRAHDDFFNKVNPALHEFEDMHNTIEEIKQQHPDLDISMVPVTGGGCKIIEDPALIDAKITPGGDIFACRGFTDPVFAIGNVKNGGIKKAVESREAKEFIHMLRSRIDNIPECGKCIWKTRLCQGGCGANAFCLHQDINTLDGFCALRKKHWAKAVFKSKKTGVKIT
jgi:Fe-coproporphyrin III synthase